jgi:predicted DNA-binding antitoxin AbrB/MazE fold protein
LKIGKCQVLKLLKKVNLNDGNLLLKKVILMNFFNKRIFYQKNSLKV